MRVSGLAGLVLLAVGCASLGTPKGPRPPFSADEQLTLTKCLGLSNIAFGVGTVKLMGGTAEDLKERYALADEQPIPVAVTNEVIDGVFRIEADSPFGYSQAYFAGCGQEVAKLSDERLPFAQSCMRQAEMALAAQIAKEKGTPQDAEVQNLAKFDVPQTKEIVARVYAASRTPGEAQADAWDWCMAPFRAQ